MVWSRPTKKIIIKTNRNLPCCQLLARGSIVSKKNALCSCFVFFASFNGPLSAVAFSQTLASEEKKGKQKINIKHPKCHISEGPKRRFRKASSKKQKNPRKREKSKTEFSFRRQLLKFYDVQTWDPGDKKHFCPLFPTCWSSRWTPIDKEEFHKDEASALIGFLKYFYYGQFLILSWKVWDFLFDIVFSFN